MKKFDVAFSLGPHCRPAYYLQLCNLRTYAYPLDWQGCSIESAIHLYETQFSDFFLEYVDLSKSKKECIKGLRYVVDTKNDIIAMHHIKADIPLEEAVDDFKNLMLKRYKRLHSNLNCAESILILCNHNRKLEVFIDFLHRFSNLYKNKKIVLVNIHSRKNGKHMHVHKINDNLEIIEYFINDVNKDGGNPIYNKRFWLGNEDKWIEILKDYFIKK